MRSCLRAIVLTTVTVGLLGLTAASAKAQGQWNRGAPWWYRDTIRQMQPPNYFSPYWSPYWGYYPRYYGGYWPGSAYYVPMPYYVPVPQSYTPSNPAQVNSKKQADPEQADPAVPADPKQQKEREAARQLKLAKNLTEAAAEEEQIGRTEDAERLRGLAKDHYQEIAKKYPTTKAGREAKRLMIEP